jgi:hypothetical protein
VPRNGREFAHKHLDTLKTANNHCFWSVLSDTRDATTVHMCKFRIFLLHKSPLLSNDHSMFDVGESPFSLACFRSRKPVLVNAVSVRFGKNSLQIKQKQACNSLLYSNHLYSLYQLDLKRLNLLPNPVPGYTFKLDWHGASVFS